MESLKLTDAYRSFPGPQPIESFQDGLEFFCQQARWLVEPEQLIELRVLDYSRGFKSSTQNGYFQATQFDRLMPPAFPFMLARRANRIGYVRGDEFTTDRLLANTEVGDQGELAANSQLSFL